MSLVHWWPLNGDNKDKIGYNTLTGILDSQFVPGKIGQAAHVSTQIATNVKYTDWNFGVGSVSFGAWFKFNKAQIAASVALPSGYSYDATYSTPTGNLLGFNYYGGLGLIYNTNDMHVSGDVMNYYYIRSILRVNSGTYVATNTYRISDVDNNWDTWIHFMLVFNKPKCLLQLYVNGTLFSSLPALNFTNNDYSANDFYINAAKIWGGNGPSKCSQMDICDVRLYDHALSKKEIKEISKACVLHYDFNDPYIEPTINYLPELNTDNYIFSTYLNRTNATVFIGDTPFGKQPIYRATTNVTVNTDTVWGLNTKNFIPCTPGEIYTISFYYKSTSKSVTYLEQRTASSGGTCIIWNDNTWLNHAPIISITSNGKWIKEGWTFTVPDGKTSLKIRIGTDTPNFYGSPDEYIDISCIQLELKDHSTIYTPTSRALDKIYDCSGYGNNGEIINDISVSSNSAIGNYSCEIKNSNYIKRQSISAEVKTLSLWVYSDSIESGVIFADAKSALGLGFYSSGTSLIVSSGSTAKPVFTLNGKYNIGAWNHIAVVFDGNNTYCYVNGSSLSQNGNTNYWSHNNNEMTIGCRYNSGYMTFFTGKIADLKLFATPLSESDIIQLYKSKAQMDINGKLFINSIVESQESKDVVLNTLDINRDSATIISSNEFEVSAWAKTIIFNNELTAKIKTNTTYYCRYKIQFLENPQTYFYTSQAWGALLLYGGDSSTNTYICNEITKDRFLQTKINDIVEVSGSFTTPASLENKVLLFYTARYANSSADWSAGCEIIKVRVTDFEVSSVPFTHENPKLVNKKYITSAYRIEELPDITLTNFIPNADTLAGTSIPTTGVGNITNGVLTFTANAQYASPIIPCRLVANLGLNNTKNHKLYLRMTARYTTSGASCVFYYNDSKNQGGPRISGNQFTDISNFYTVEYNATGGYTRIQDNRASDWTEYQAKQPMLLDLHDSGLYNVLERLGYKTDALKKKWIDENIPFFVGTYKIPKDKFKIMKTGEIISPEFIEN